METILVTGATGKVGRYVVAELLAGGAQVRVLVRDVERARAVLDNADADYVQSDLDAPDRFPAALVGCRQLFLLTRDGPRQISQATALARAAVAAGVEHIVKLSSSNTGPEAVFAWAREHYAIEQEIESLGIGYSHIRAHYFMQNLLTVLRSDGKRIMLELPLADGRISAIDARDVAACSAAILLSRRPLNRAVVITGSQSFSMDEAADALSAVSPGTVVYRDVPADEHLTGLLAAGVSQEQAESVSLMYSWARDGRMERVTNGVREVTGHAPRSLEQFAREVAVSRLTELQ